MTLAPDKMRTTIVISKSDRDALEKLARADDRSVNYLINKAIKEYIKNHAE